MMKLVFPNGTTWAKIPDVECMLNRTHKEPVPYWARFDESGTPEAIGHAHAFYAIDWVNRACGCPTCKHHGACKHLDALALLIPRLVRTRCMQCDGDGIETCCDGCDLCDGSGFYTCDRCMGEGEVWTVLPPKETALGAR